MIAVEIPTDWTCPPLAQMSVLDMLYDARQGLIADGDTDILEDNTRAIERELERRRANWRDPHCPMGHNDGDDRPRGNGGGGMGGGRGAQIYATDKAIEFATHICNRLGREVPQWNRPLASEVSKVIDEGKAELAEQGIPVYGASPAQLDKIEKLMMERYTDYRELLVGAKKLGSREASKLIDHLLSIPRDLWTGTGKVETRQTEPTKPGQKIPGHGPGREHEPKAGITDGMYKTPDGDIVKVQKAIHGSGGLYAKKLVKLDYPKITAKGEKTWEFVYAPGLIRQLKAEWKMTLEQAQEWGHLYGACCNCGATLTDEKSIEAGIGPVCAKKFR